MDTECQDKLDLKDLKEELDNRLDKELYIDDRMSVVNNILAKYDDVIIHCTETYNAPKNNANLMRKKLFDICMDRLSNYLLFAPDVIEEGQYKTEMDILNSIKDSVSINTGLEYVIDNEGNIINNINYDFNKNSYTIKDYDKIFENNDKVMSIIQPYKDYAKNMMEFISCADKSLSSVDGEEEVEFELENKKYKVTIQNLKNIKSILGYTGNNFVEIDKSIIAVYEEFYQPMNSVNNIEQNKTDEIVYSDYKIGKSNGGYTLDLSNPEDVKAVIKFAHIEGVSEGFDKYVEKIDELVLNADLTNVQSEVYAIGRKYNKNGSNTPNLKNKSIYIAEHLGTTRQYIDKVHSAIAKKVSDEYKKDKSFHLMNNKDLHKGKICSTCGRVLPANRNFFRVNKSSKSGLRSSCKECEAQQRQKEKKSNQKKKKEK